MTKLLSPNLSFNILDETNTIKLLIQEIGITQCKQTNSGDELVEQKQYIQAYIPGTPKSQLNKYTIIYSLTTPSRSITQNHRPLSNPPPPVNSNSSVKFPNCATQ